MVKFCRKGNARRAFTLVEVMFGVVLCGFAVATLSSVIPLATKGQRASREYLQMADIAQAKMDRLKDLGYGRLNKDEISAATIGTETAMSDVYQFTLTTGVDAVTNATGKITISDYSPNIKRVVVGIKWKSGGAQATESSHELQGLIARE
jgi:type II secretory pathway pseudopilin PulG